MEEIYANLYRVKRSNQGTEGVLYCKEFSCFTLELPWRDNQRSISCIPSGEYYTKIRKSPRFGLTYHITEVPGRSYILIHSGNWAGDTSLGFKSHVNGCILLGKSRGLLAGQIAVLNSRITIKRFMEFMDQEPFTLRILEAF